MITFGSLFAGIGGFDLGFERAGMACNWQVEIDDYCNLVLAKHWPDVERFRDVRECGRANLEPVDVICGGFPCQPFSAAGKRRGAEDDRNLWPEFRRIVEEVRPRWVVAENVPGIVKLYLDTVLSDLEGLGYATAQVVIPAVAFDAPHRRDRLWIVAFTEPAGTGNKSGSVGGQKRPALDTGSTSIRQAYWPASASRHNTNGGVVANAISNNGHGGRSNVQVGRQRQSGNAKEGCNTAGNKWRPESGIRRVAHGIPRRVDRLRALGNAVVPQAAEHIGRLIVEVDKELTT